LEQALSYPWPGNLQELAGLVRRSLPRPGAAEWQFPPLLNPEVTEASVPPFHAAKREFEVSYVQRLLLLTEGNVSRAAELAGKARKDFYALMSRARVDPALFRTGAGE
jgi:two-component system response regulator GlrR